MHGMMLVHMLLGWRLTITVTCVTKMRQRYLLQQESAVSDDLIIQTTLVSGWSPGGQNSEVPLCMYLITKRIYTTWKVWLNDSN